MFYDDETERALRNRDTDRSIKYDNKPLIKRGGSHNLERVVGGSDSGVTELEKSTPTKTKKPNAWQALVKKTMSEQGLTMINAIKYIKSNNLY